MKEKGSINITTFYLLKNNGIRVVCFLNIKLPPVVENVFLLSSHVNDNLAELQSWIIPFLP